MGPATRLAEYLHDARHLDLGAVPPFDRRPPRRAQFSVRLVGQGKHEIHIDTFEAFIDGARNGGRQLPMLLGRRGQLREEPLPILRCGCEVLQELARAAQVELQKLMEEQ